MGVPTLWQSQKIEKANDGDSDLKRSAKVVGISLLLAIAALSVWVLIPPFPSPPALVGKPSSALVSLLGPATGALPDKFVAWEQSRGVAVWTLEASYIAWPVDPDSVTTGIKRCLWIKWAGISVLCQRAVVARA
jgi:hypothetical protein